MATGKDSSAYEVLVGKIPPMSLSEDFLKKYGLDENEQPGFAMVDLRGATNPLNVSGNYATFTEFKGPENTRGGTDRIDFIFGGSNRGWLAFSLLLPG